MKLFQSSDPTIPTAGQLTSHVHDKFGTAETAAASTADKLLGLAMTAVGNAARSGDAQFFRDGRDYGVQITVRLKGKDLRAYNEGQNAFRATKPADADYFESQKAFDGDLERALTDRLTAALVTEAFGYSKASGSVKTVDRGEDVDNVLSLRLEWTKP